MPAMYHSRIINRDKTTFAAFLTKENVLQQTMRHLLTEGMKIWAILDHIINASSIYLLFVWKNHVLKKNFVDRDA